MEFFLGVLVYSWNLNCNIGTIRKVNFPCGWEQHLCAFQKLRTGKRRRLDRNFWQSLIITVTVWGVRMHHRFVWQEADERRQNYVPSVNILETLISGIEKMAEGVVIGIPFWVDKWFINLSGCPFNCASISCMTQVRTVLCLMDCCWHSCFHIECWSASEIYESLNDFGEKSV